MVAARPTRNGRSRGLLTTRGYSELSVLVRLVASVRLIPSHLLALQPRKFPSGWGPDGILTPWRAEGNLPWRSGTPSTSPPMLHSSVVFLVIALIAGVLGFGVIASTAASIAKILFLVFVVIFLISVFRGRRV